MSALDIDQDLIRGVARPASTTELVFPAERGGAMRSQGFQHTVLTDAANRLGLTGLHPHALRHTAASLAITSGATVKVVQQMLGHKSATRTLDRYGHLFPDQLDDVAERLDAAGRVPDVYRAAFEITNKITGNDYSPRVPGAVGT